MVDEKKGIYMTKKCSVPSGSEEKGQRKISSIGEKKRLCTQ